MHNDAAFLIVVLVFIATLALTRPFVLRALAQFAEYTGERGQARAARRTPVDEEAESLRLWSKRCRLGAALDRVERLLATDSWMSGTRQLGNRMAYDQLVAELSRIPDVFPNRPYAPLVEVWSETYPTKRRSSSASDRWDDKHQIQAWSATVPAGPPSRPGQVEVLDIGWRRRP
jgi:hypothetical protein